MSTFDILKELEKFGVQDVYQYLNVSRDATSEEIAHACRLAIKKIGINQNQKTGSNDYEVQILVTIRRALLDREVRAEINRRLASQKQQSTMDFKDKSLKSNRLVYSKMGNLSYWGVSLTGKSNLEAGIPCQDANYIRIVNATNHPTIIAAIADGIASSHLSHYGSSIVVNAVIEYLTQKFNTLDMANISDKDIGIHIRAAMQCALDAVNEEAKLSNQLPYSYCSTLTTALYDGEKLYFGHVGDGGIITLTDGGQLSLLTKRMKGEVPHSVFPLQAGRDYWEVGKTIVPIDGFMMATHGIIDSVVMGRDDNNYEIYYPFMKPGLTDTSDILATGQLYVDEMRTPAFRNRVPEDITVVFATNDDKIKRNPILKKK